MVKWWMELVVYFVDIKMRIYCYFQKKKNIRVRNIKTSYSSSHN